MKVEAEQLDQWARQAMVANNAALRGVQAARRGDVSAAEAELWTIQEKANLLRRGLVAAGALDPTTQEESPANPIPVPLHLLATDKAKAYAEAIRAAAVACRAMEEERHGGPVDGFWEHLDSYAAEAELEAFGPKTRQE